MDGERGRCCDEVIMVKTLTAEARLWVDRYSVSNSSLLYVGNFHNKFRGNVFQWSNVDIFVWFHRVFTPHFAKRSLQVSFLCHQQICLAETPLALFFPEFGAGGGGSLSPTPPPKFGLNCPNVLITAPSSPVSGL